jgi:transglutaminase-like putative cysteine protease
VRLLIEHETRLAFPQPVREHQCELRLAPRDDETQRRLSCAIEVEPAAELRSHLDCFGNQVHRFSLLAPHEGLVARVRSEVETSLANPFSYAPLAPAAEKTWLAQRLRDEPRLLDFVLHRSEAVPELGVALGELPVPAFAPEQPLLDNVQAAMRWAQESFRWDPSTTEVHSALAAFAEQRAGVCQDFAHLLVSLVRSWGFAARYVMGYVEGNTVPEEAQSEQATHAWAEVLIPGAGWRGFDATSGLVANDCYVPVAVGRDSRDAAPVRGTFKGDESFALPQVSVRVQRAEQECAAQ